MCWAYHLQVTSSNAKRLCSVKQGRKKEAAPLYWGTETEWTRVLESLRQIQEWTPVLWILRGLDWRTVLPHLWTAVCKRSEVSTENYMKTTSFKLRPLLQKSEIIPMRSWGIYITAEREGTRFEGRLVYTHRQWHKNTSQQQSFQNNACSNKVYEKILTSQKRKGEHLKR